MLIFAMVAVSSAADVTNIQGKMTSVGVKATGTLETDQLGLMRKTPRAHVGESTFPPSLIASNQSHNRLDSAGLPGTASQSSTYMTGVAQNGMDGSYNTMAHTAGGQGEANPWWQVQFEGGRKAVKSITFVNRQSSCASRLFLGWACAWQFSGSTFAGADQGAIFGVSDHPCEGEICSGQRCEKLTQPSESAGQGHVYTIECKDSNGEPLRGRYAYVQLPGNERMLNFMEFEVQEASMEVGSQLTCGTWTSPEDEEIPVDGDGQCYEGFVNVDPENKPPSYFPVEARFDGAWMGGQENHEATISEFDHGASPHSKRSVWMARIETQGYYKMILFELWWTEGENPRPCLKQSQAKYKVKGSEALENDEQWAAAWESGKVVPQENDYRITQVDLVSCVRRHAPR